MHLQTAVFNSFIHIILVLFFEAVFLFGILYPLLTRIAKNITINVNNTIFDNILRFDIIKESDAFVYNPKTELFEFNNPFLKAMLESCAVDEKRYMMVQNYMPYIVFSVLVFSLLIGTIIWFFITRQLGLFIDWKFVFITSIISFGLICGFAFAILWFVVFTQPYVMDLNAELFETFLEVYLSA